LIKELTNKLERLENSVLNIYDIILEQKKINKKMELAIEELREK